MLAGRKIMERKSYPVAWRTLNCLVASSLDSLYRMMKIELRLLFH